MLITYFAFIKERFTGLHFLEKVQDLPTTRAATVQCFTIMNGSLFLTFANYRWDIHKYKTSSAVTNWMNRHENAFCTSTYWLCGLPVEWTAVCGVPEITKRRSCTPQVLRDKRRRISRVAGHHDGSTYLTKWVIYKWNDVKFIKSPEIATDGAMGCKAEVQFGVFKLSGVHFVKLQSLQSHGAYDVKSVNINGHTFIAFACHNSWSS